MSSQPLILNTSGVPSTINTSGNSGPIAVWGSDNLLFAFKVAGGSGTTPTLDVYIDYLDPAGNTIAVGIVHLTQFVGSGAGATFSNVGPVNGGGGFILPTLIQIRWVLGGTASPTYTGCVATLEGR